MSILAHNFLKRMKSCKAWHHEGQEDIEAVSSESKLVYLLYLYRLKLVTVQG